jgi:arrestin-related trafficking adapter 3/6
MYRLQPEHWSTHLGGNIARVSSGGSAGEAISPVTSWNGITRTATQGQMNACSFCFGNPRTLVSSHSGSITLAVSLQEPVLFLPSVPTSTSSYREQDPEPITNESVPYGSSPPTVPTATSSSAPIDNYQPVNIDSVPFGSSTGAHFGIGRDLSDLPPSMLRGSVILKLGKPTKIKSLSLCFFGVCKTSWTHSSGGIMDEAHTISEIQDTLYIDSHCWEFMSSENTAQTSAIHTDDNSLTQVYTNLHGADVAILKSQPDRALFKNENSRVLHSPVTQIVSDGNTPIAVFAPSSTLKRKLKQPTSKGTATLMPAGEYIYHFTLAVDAKTPESVLAPNGSIKYFLVPKLIRTGPFTMNLTATQEVDLVRSPPNNCDSSSNNPIVISRNWDRRLHYEIVVPQKYIPLGSSIPVAIKLTPLEKVTVHRVRVHVLETIEYICSVDSSIKYHDRTLKLLLYEKRASPLDPSSSGQEYKTKRLGNLLATGPDQTGGDVTSTTIDCKLPFLSEPNEWEAVPAQYLTKSSVSDKIKFLHPDASSSPFLRVRHRLVVSLRISKKDGDGDKRRNFEVKIDTPIHFLSKFCIRESVDLPRYNFDDMVPLGQIASHEYDVTTATPPDDIWQEDELWEVPEPPPDYATVVKEGDRQRFVET